MTRPARPALSLGIGATVGTAGGLFARFKAMAAP